MNPRTINRWFPQGRPRTRHCSAANCARATREGKPFCSEHVERLPYVQGLLDQLAAREDEEDRVRKRGTRAVDPNGLTAREILLSLWVNGDRTVARLARELNMDFETLKVYVAALKRKGLVTVKPTRRGAGIVTLVPQVAQIEDPRFLTEQAEGGQSAA